MNNWYIDFDSTLYNTSELIKDMLNSIATYISIKKSLNKSSILEELNSLFNRENIYNIFTLCSYLENKYQLKQSSLSNRINNILNNGNKYVFDDVAPFLKELRDQKCKIYMLTSSITKENIEFHELKLKGSGICNLFDTILITAEPKHTLDLKYENGIFVDDNPEDLNNLYEAKAKKVIRIKRKDNRYSKKILNNPEIEEYTTLSGILF